jgi:hypothetical protein
LINHQNFGILANKSSYVSNSILKKKNRKDLGFKKNKI